MRSSRPTSARRGTLSRIKVSLGEEACDHQRQRGVLGARDRDGAVERPAADDTNAIHFQPPRPVAGPARSVAYFPARIAAKVGSGSDIGIGGRHILGLAAARLLLAPLEVFPQARRQPRAPRRPFLGFAGFDHGGNLKACWLRRRNNSPGGQSPRLESGLDRLDSALFVCLVKDRRPPEAAALRAVLDKNTNTNNQHPSDQGRHPIE